MYIVLLVAWCGGVACGTENKEEKWETRLVVVKENFNSFLPFPSSLPSLKECMHEFLMQFYLKLYVSMF